MICYIKRPGELMEEIHIKNDLKALQFFVGGNIEVVNLGKFVMICNEEGKLLDLEPNFHLGSDVIVGAVIFCDVDGEEFCDIGVTQEEILAEIVRRCTTNG